MPTYEYVCKSCGQHHEVVQSFTDASLTECPSCAGPLRKVFGNIGITFKGDGFYKTDSRSAAKASSSNGSSSSTDSGSEKGDTKAEKPAETKAEAKKETASTSSSSDAG